VAGAASFLPVATSNLGTPWYLGQEQTKAGHDGVGAEWGERGGSSSAPYTGKGELGRRVGEGAGAHRRNNYARGVRDMRGAGQQRAHLSNALSTGGLLGVRRGARGGAKAAYA
jgi:hypothetical protein